MRERNVCPSHPGIVLRQMYMEPLGLTCTSLAKSLGLSRKTLSKITNGKGAVIPETALRLSRAFKTTPDLWLNMQGKYDLWMATHSSDTWREVKPLEGLEAE